MKQLSCVIHRHGQAERAQRGAARALHSRVPRPAACSGRRARRHKAGRLPLASDAWPVRQGSQVFSLSLFALSRKAVTAFMQVTCTVAAWLLAMQDTQSTLPRRLLVLAVVLHIYADVRALYAEINSTSWTFCRYDPAARAPGARCGGWGASSWRWGSCTGAQYPTDHACMTSGARARGSLRRLGREQLALGQLHWSPIPYGPRMYDQRRARQGLAAAAGARAAGAGAAALERRAVRAAAGARALGRPGRHVRAGTRVCLLT